MSTKDTHDRQTAEEQRLDSLWAELCDLDSAARLLEWDQETGMPHGGGAGRARSLSTLAGLHHRLLTADALADAVAACAALVDSRASSEDAVRLAAKVRQAGRAVTRARKIPERLTRELASARSAVGLQRIGRVSLIISTPREPAP